MDGHVKLPVLVKYYQFINMSLVADIELKTQMHKIKSVDCAKIIDVIALCLIAYPDILSCSAKSTCSILSRDGAIEDMHPD